MSTDLTSERGDNISLNMLLNEATEMPNQGKFYAKNL